MPNHFTTRCTITGPAHSISDLRRLVFVDDPKRGLRFDLERIVPIPDCFPKPEHGVSSLPETVLEILIKGPGVPVAWEQMSRFRPEIGPWKGLFSYSDGEMEALLEKAHPGCIAEARTVARCFGETGYFNVIDWAYGEWGTKWNAYQLELEDEQDERLHFTFETANGFPEPVFRRLAKAFPDLKFECLYFDEGWNTAGRGFFNPGPGDAPFEHEKATDELYELVYRRPRDEDDEAA